MGPGCVMAAYHEAIIRHAPVQGTLFFVPEDVLPLRFPPTCR
jgi:hypothetical protein